MKKQILFMMFFVLAVLAGTVNSFAQYQVGPSTIGPRPMSCTDDYPLHPRPGIPYVYKVDVPDDAGDDVPINGYIWWATKNQNFIDSVASSANFGNPDTTDMLEVASGELIDVSTPYGVYGAPDSIEITWSPQILANTHYQGDPGPETPTFVAVMAIGECTNNIEVYEINPSPAFTVDITNVSPNSLNTVPYDSIVDQCVSEVYSANYNMTSKELDMNYGWDTLYFEVVAANFVENWIPHMAIRAGLEGDQVAEVGWAASLDSARVGDFIESASTGLTVGDSIIGTVPIASNIDNTVDGVSIFVRVVISNNTYELDGADGPNTFELSVDGIDSTNQWDLVNDTCVDPDAPDGDDIAQHIITPRPTVDDDTEDDESTPPNDLIIKTEN